MNDLIQKISKIISLESGNILGPDQANMVKNRIEKRLSLLGNITFDEYEKYFELNKSNEVKALISLLTTHHTYFFREFIHFEYIKNNLNNFIQAVKDRKDNKIRIYSAACSRGHEVYSLSLFFHQLLLDFPSITYEILGTDIDIESINYAKNGVYPFEEVKNIPLVYLNNNWQRGTGEIASFAKIKKHIKDHCTFEVDNLLTIKSLANKKFDIIFCRNVFIYLTSTDVVKICNVFKNHIYPHGILITGLSENLRLYDFPKKSLAPSIYQFTASNDKTANEIVKTKQTQPLRLLIVDDSASIVKILAKCFDNDEEFKIVGFASDGVQAHHFLQKNTVDVMTLDIHMPNMDGIEYLKNYYQPGHPKVVIVSSVDRQDTHFAQKSFLYGASDFVEKPTLNNIDQKKDEIKMKLKSAYYSTKVKADHDFAKKFTNDFKIEQCLLKNRVWFGHLNDKDKFRKLFIELSGEQPPLFIFLENDINVLQLIKDDLYSNLINIYNNQEIKCNNIYLCSFELHYNSLQSRFNSKNTTFATFGIPSNQVIKSIKNIKNIHLLVEDIVNLSSDITSIATDLFPWTSIAHMGTEYLGRLK